MTLGFAVVTLAILALLLAIYWQLARPILWAVTLAVLFYPLHRPSCGSCGDASPRGRS